MNGPRKPCGDVTLIRKGATFPLEWPHACFWDGHPFDNTKNRPVGCPVQFVQDTRNRRVPCIGVFCSWNCALAYGQVFLPPTQRLLVGSYIHQLVMHLNRGLPTEKKVPLPVAAAPHYAVLEKYGGVVTIERFRARNCNSVMMVWPESSSNLCGPSVQAEHLGWYLMEHRCGQHSHPGHSMPEDSCVRLFADNQVYLTSSCSNSPSIAITTAESKTSETPPMAIMTPSPVPPKTNRNTPRATENRPNVKPSKPAPAVPAPGTGPEHEESDEKIKERPAYKRRRTRQAVSEMLKRNKPNVAKEAVERRIQSRSKDRMAEQFGFTFVKPKPN